MIETTIGEDGAATITLSRLAAKNAVSTAMWQALHGAIEHLGDTPRVVTITSAVSGMFCPGADIKEFPALMASADARKKMRVSMQQAVDALERAPYPTIAVINGPCVGAGVSIAAACDLRIASTKARFGVTPAKLGVVYSKDDVRRLVAIIGQAHARDLLLTGRLMGADEAKEMGLVHQLAAPDALAGAAYDLASDLLSRSSQTHRSIKRILRSLSGIEMLEESALATEFEDAFASPDATARIEAMLKVLNKAR